MCRYLPKTELWERCKNPPQQPAEVQECRRPWSCWAASTAEALKQFRQSFTGAEVPATEDMPKLRAALNALIPATEDMPRLREAPPPPPPLPPPLAPASSARLSPTSPAQPAPRSAQAPAPQYPPSAAYLSWPTCHPSPAWRASVCPADVGGAYTRPIERSDPGGPFFDPEPESRGSFGGCPEQARAGGLLPGDSRGPSPPKHAPFCSGARADSVPVGDV